MSSGDSRQRAFDESGSPARPPRMTSDSGFMLTAASYHTTTPQHIMQTPPPTLAKPFGADGARVSSRTVEQARAYQPLRARQAPWVYRSKRGESCGHMHRGLTAAVACYRRNGAPVPAQARVPQVSHCLTLGKRVLGSLRQANDHVVGFGAPPSRCTVMSGVPPQIGQCLATTGIPIAP